MMHSVNKKIVTVITITIIFPMIALASGSVGDLGATFLKRIYNCKAPFIKCICQTDTKAVHELSYNITDKSNNSIQEIEGKKFFSIPQVISWSESNNGLEEGNVIWIISDPGDSQLVYCIVDDKGIFKSTNGAQTWNLFNERSDITSIYITPNESDTMYATTENSFLKSTDGGTSWDNVNPIEDFKTRRYCFAFDPGNTQIIYLGTDSGLFRSSNGAQTWDCLIKDEDILCLAIGPKNNQTIYASISDKGVYKSEDGGQDWWLIFEPSWFHDILGIKVNPYNPQEIWLNDYLPPSWLKSYKTNDGGQNWDEYTLYYIFVFDSFHEDVIYGWESYLPYNLLKVSMDGGGIWHDISPTGGAPSGHYFLTSDNWSLPQRTIYIGTVDGILKGIINLGTSDITTTTTTTTVSPSPQDKTLARIEGYPEVYWLQNKKAYHVLSFDIIDSMSTLPGWDRNNIFSYQEDELIIDPQGISPVEGHFESGPNFIGISEDSEGLLIRRYDDHKVFLIEQGKRRWLNVTPEEFIQNGMRFEDVIEVTPELLTNHFDRIIFQSSRLDDQNTEDGEIYIMNDNGSNLIQITKNDSEDGTPTYSPVSNDIIFSSWHHDRDGLDPCWHLWLMKDWDENQLIDLSGSCDGWPAYSPDGNKIAFSSDINNNGYYYTIVFDLESGSGFGLTPIISGCNKFENHAAWSPDGKKIAYTSYNPCGDNGRGIYIMNSDGSETAVNITGSDSYNDYPQWSPDGNKIAFASDRRSHDGYRLDIYIMNQDGSECTVLYPMDGDERYPSWSPDGKKIVFAHGGNYDNLDIYTIDTDGKGPPVRLTFNSGGHPSYLIGKTIENFETTTTTIITTSSTTIKKSTTTTTTILTTTTTTTYCPISYIYDDEHSEETELLRYLRDNVLSQTPEGQELIKLYYELSPAIVKAMEEDEEFKAQVKEMSDEVLELIEGGEKK